MFPSPNQNQTQTETRSTPTVWSHEETITLIQSYQDKWYSLNRTPLKHTDWEEISRIITHTKSATQCRHKMETLRKRYRSELLKTPHTTSFWVYFPLMHRLEHGSGSVQAHVVVPIVNRDHDDRFRDQNQNQNQGGGQQLEQNRDYYLQYRGGYTQGEEDMQQNERVKRSRNCYQDDDAGRNGVKDEEEEEEVTDLGGGMREFVERFVKMEKMKMEIMRENERFKIEMENKRLQMILVSHQKTADLISKTFGLKN